MGLNSILVYIYILRLKNDNKESLLDPLLSSD